MNASENKELRRIAVMTPEQCRAEGRRSLGVVREYKSQDDDGRWWSVCLWLSDSLGTQGMQLTFNNEEESLPWRRALLRLFGHPGVRTNEDAAIQSLIGQECYVLRCWGTHNDAIEGLEVAGRRLCRTSFLDGCGERIKRPIERERDSVSSEIRFLERRLSEERAKLRTLEDEYVDWKSVGL